MVYEAKLDRALSEFEYFILKEDYSNYTNVEVKKSSLGLYACIYVIVLINIFSYKKSMCILISENSPLNSASFLRTDYKL